MGKIRIVADDEAELIPVSAFAERVVYEIECHAELTSDGYHTFGELYEHRCLLFIGLLRLTPWCSWRAWKHWDNTAYEGWFIAGTTLPMAGEISYHLPARMWELCEGIETYECGAKWDGHTPEDVLNRIRNWLLAGVIPSGLKPAEAYTATSAVVIEDPDWTGTSAKVPTTLTRRAA